MHIIHQLHHHFEDKSVLPKSFEANFDNKACRRGADFVTYTVKEMETLKGKDEKRGLPEWTPLLAGSSIFLLIFFNESQALIQVLLSLYSCLIFGSSYK